MKIKFITLPNLLTLANLFCGMLGVVVMVSQQTEQALKYSFILMIAAAVFDFFDGFAARLTKQYSKLGAQLDSLADMVSFGVLPTLIAMKVYYLVGGYGWWSAVIMLIVLCAALRLAKFNISEDQKTEFEGLPVPACALFIGAAGWYASQQMPIQAPEYMQWVVLALSVVFAYLMVSPVRMFSLKFSGFGFRNNALRYVFILMSLLIILLTGAKGIGLVIVLYVLTSVIRWLARSRR